MQADQDLSNSQNKTKIFDFNHLICEVKQERTFKKNEKSANNITQFFNFPSSAENDVFQKSFQMQFPTCILGFKDTFIIKFQMASTAAMTSGNNPSKQDRSNDNNSTDSKMEQKKSKKKVLFRRRLRGGVNSTGGDKKNIVKNVITAYLNYLKEQQEDGQDVIHHIEILKKMISNTRFNNQLVASIVEDRSLRLSFSQFLNQAALLWIRHSKIHNKEIHEQAISLYLKMCIQYAKEFDPSSQRERIMSNHDANEVLFQSGINNSLDEEIRNFK